MAQRPTTVRSADVRVSGQMTDALDSAAFAGPGVSRQAPLPTWCNDRHNNTGPLLRSPRSAKGVAGPGGRPRRGQSRVIRDRLSTPSGAAAVFTETLRAGPSARLVTESVLSTAESHLQLPAPPTATPGACGCCAVLKEDAAPHCAS